MNFLLIIDNTNLKGDKMNQILDKNYTSRSKITVEFSNEIAEIPYIETKKFKLKKDNYKIQFFISSIIATLGCFIFLVNLIKSHSQEKISKKLLNNYNLTTLYQTETPSSQQSSNVPFISIITYYLYHKIHIFSIHKVKKSNQPTADCF